MVDHTGPLARPSSIEPDPGYLFRELEGLQTRELNTVLVLGT
jgi:hypothetical protein